jgi:pimeloyl-CoA dehydrogenase small subunit
MDFDLTEEQQIIKGAIERLIEDNYGDFERRRTYMKEPGGRNAAIWQDFAAMGLTGLPFEESLGGAGGGPVETMIVMEAIGKGLCLEPFLSSVVLSGAALKLAASEAQKETLIQPMIRGEFTMSVAYVERQSRFDLFDVATTARKTEGGYVLNGQKSVVLNGDSAGKFIVSARTSGERRDKNGITLFMVDAKTSGLEVHGYEAQDGQHVAELSFSNVAVPASDILGEADRGLPILEAAIDHGIAATAAEAVGAMEALHQLTVDYLKTRSQFGVPIAKFQVLQHDAVDMFIALEQARSMAMFAAMSLSAPPLERADAISAAKVQINRSAREIGQLAIQLHGGIGMTFEYKGAHYFKKLTVLETLFGDADHHLARLSDGSGLLADSRYDKSA